MTWAETLPWVTFVLGLTFSAILLVAALLMFQRLGSDPDVSQTPTIALLPIFDILWGLSAPILHWKESKLGRKLSYWLLAALAVTGVSLFLILRQPSTPASVPVPPALLELVEQTESHVIDLTAPSALFSSMDFRQIYEQPHQFVPQARSILVSKTATARQKTIVVYGVQRLAWKDYLQLLQFAAEEANRGRIDPSIVDLMISPGLDWSTRVISNYKNQEVRNTLIKFAENLDTNQQKSIERILSGETWQDAREFPWSKLDY